MKRVALLSGLLLATAVVVWWRWPAAAYDWPIAEHLPRPDVPIDNPMSAAKVELGRHLFYDERLSVNGTVSCATCHLQSLAFTDGKTQSIGATGELHPRSSMSLVNSAYASRLTWANHLLARLEDQALMPLLGTDPIEMGAKPDQVVETIRADAFYAEQFPRVFSGDADSYSVLNVVRAQAAFVRSIVSFDSPYDQYLAGDADALSDSAVRGMDLFFSERLECFHCHGGFNFTDSTTHANANIERVGFHNNALYNVDDFGAYPEENTGLFDMTGNRRDMGRFKAPTLRNIAVTAPYMHDGSVATLEDVIAHYARAGRNVTEGPHTGDGRRNPFKSEFIVGFELTDRETEDLLAFLHALTDERVLSDPAFSDPWAIPSPTE